MAIIEPGNVISGSGLNAPFRNAGAPVNTTAQVDTLTSTATAGIVSLNITVTTADGSRTYKVSFAATATAAAINTALAAVSPVLANLVAAGGALGTNPVTLTGSNALLNKTVAITVDNTAATGGACTIAHTTAGVIATFGGKAAKGSTLIDTTNAIFYQNTGTQNGPTWSKVGLES